jgi:hypothetical protein
VTPAPRARARRVSPGGPRPLTLPNLVVGSTTTLVNSSGRLLGWSVNAASGSETGLEASLAVGAAAAGTLTLTGFAGVSQVTVAPAAAWPAGLNQVTVTNVSGGTQTADIEGGTENPLIISFIPSVGVTGTPVVSVPAIAAGPAYTIDATGISQAAGILTPNVSANLLDGGQVIGVPGSQSGVPDTAWFGDEGVFYGTSLVITVTAGTINGVIYIRDRWYEETE